MCDTFLPLEANGSRTVCWKIYVSFIQLPCSFVTTSGACCLPVPALLGSIPCAASLPPPPPGCSSCRHLERGLPLPPTLPSSKLFSPARFVLPFRRNVISQDYFIRIWNLAIFFFNRNWVQPVCQLGRIGIFIMLNLPIHEHGYLSLYLEDFDFFGQYCVVLAYTFCTFFVRMILHFHFWVI